MVEVNIGRHLDDRSFLQQKGQQFRTHFGRLGGDTGATASRSSFWRGPAKPRFVNSFRISSSALQFRRQFDPVGIKTEPVLACEQPPAVEHPLHPSSTTSGWIRSERRLFSSLLVIPQRSWFPFWNECSVSAAGHRPNRPHRGARDASCRPVGPARTEPVPRRSLDLFGVTVRPPG